MSNIRTYGAQVPTRCYKAKEIERLFDEGYRMICSLTENIKCFNFGVKAILSSKISRYGQPGIKPPIDYMLNRLHIDFEVGKLYRCCKDLERDLASIEEEIFD
ncbi:uncharacterized protein LOC26514152 isoform X2 [Drosophila ananassae]|uniref:uncharacterized protein LOC26514152 isoform X2 n=1 Tax=Drosophila ananassae TaxID=7217 RepID=UPI0013A5C0D1|nr:uncharacterized protein LOC26514152 isoform X2 [Drosophila ananassae]